jgi:hypothetical protein
MGRECKNYRGISLLSVPMKIFSAILLLRIRAACDALRGEEQTGFRPGRSCNNIIAGGKRLRNERAAVYLGFEISNTNEPQNTIDHQSQQGIPRPEQDMVGPNPKQQDQVQNV